LSVSVQNNLRKIFYFGLAFFIISAISAALTQNLPSYTELDHRSEEVIPPSQSVEPASALQMAETRLREANRNKEYYTKISNILEIFLKIFTVFDFIWYVTTTEGSLLHPLMLVKVYFLTQVIKSTSDLRYKSHFSYEISQNTLQSFLAEITALQIKASLKKYGQLQCISVRAFPNHPPLESNETKEIFYKTLQSCGGEHVNELIIICPTDNEEFKNQLTSLRAGQAIETKSATNSAYR
jgi:hypothetical protein